MLCKQFQRGVQSEELIIASTEYMDKCCKRITKACWDGNFCFMGHPRLDRNKTPMLQSPALQNKLIWAHNLTHDQANWAACQAAGELGSR